MSNDELTPEEREALANLPRERMPSAGLEDRVVAAMREKGHLSRKPARVIRLTTSRVAGLLAACLVLMIGAYSIGLHRGVDNEVLKKVEPQREGLAVQSPSEEIKSLGLPPTKRDELSRSPQSMSIPEPLSDKDQVANEPAAPSLKWELNVPKMSQSADAKKEERESDVASTESLQKTLTEGIAGATDMAAPSSPPMPAQLRAKAAREAPPEHWRTFALNSGTLIVDAPDSVRVETDEQGRTLLIYTAHGVIRVRLAD